MAPNPHFPPRHLQNTMFLKSKKEAANTTGLKTAKTQRSHQTNRWCPLISCCALNTEAEGSLQIAAFPSLLPTDLGRTIPSQVKPVMKRKGRNFSVVSEIHPGNQRCSWERVGENTSKGENRVLCGASHEHLSAQMQEWIKMTRCGKQE